MKQLLSIFDYSGAWPLPFQGHGFQTHSLDIKSGFDVLKLNTMESWLDMFPEVDAVIAAPPCTDFSVSGAQWWGAKDADGRTSMSIALVRQLLRVVDMYRPTDDDYDGVFFWALENPIGRIGKLIPAIGEPHWYEPWQYAGWLPISQSDHNELDRLRRKDGKGFCRAEVEFVIECNAYTKKTGLWGEFNPSLEKRPIEPVRCTSIGSAMTWFGGKSESTKTSRSNTPMGFATAFCEANREHRIEGYTDWGSVIKYVMETTDFCIV